MPAVGPLTEDDIPGALRIALRELGEDYLSAADFREALGTEGSFCLVARRRSEVVGFAICRIFGPDELDDRLRLPDGPERELLASKDVIGLFDSVSVAEDSKGMGVGSLLTDRCLEVFLEAGAGIAVAMGWEDRDGRCNIDGILVGRLGMERAYAIEGYWNQFVDSPGGHMCPSCGRPCRCSGRLFHKVL